MARTGGREGIREQAAALGLVYDVPAGWRTGRWTVTCADCGVQEHKGWPFDTAPEKMMSNMQRAGWQIDKKHGNKCSACVCIEIETRRMKHQMSKTDQTITGAIYSPPPAPTVTPIGPDPKIARRVYQELDDHFDEAKRLYKGGETDASIAKRIGASETVVSAIRKQAYGELAENPEWEKIRADMAIIRADFDDRATKLLEEFEDKFQTISNRIKKLNGKD